MLLHSVRMQTAAILRKRTAAVTYLLLMEFVIVNFGLNLSRNHAVQYVSRMFDPVKTLTLSDWSIPGHYMMEYFPLLVVVPTACSYMDDRETRMQVYMEGRTGRSSLLGRKVPGCAAGSSGSGLDTVKRDDLT